jgi:hypothetical protein
MLLGLTRRPLLTEGGEVREPQDARCRIVFCPLSQRDGVCTSISSHA